MKAIVLRRFRDKETKEINNPGDVVVYEEERGKSLVERKFIKEDTQTIQEGDIPPKSPRKRKKKEESES